jgi:hypothetical protein
MFYYAMLASETPIVKAKVMYYAVLVGGPRWTVVEYFRASTSGVHEAHRDPAFRRPENWAISFDSEQATSDANYIEAMNPSLEEIEELAAGSFTGTEPASSVLLPPSIDPPLPRLFR